MSAINAISSCARGAVIAPEACDLYVADLAQMEARILAWLAGQEDVLQGFRDGVDMYCRDASTIYGHEVTPKMKQKRFVGKVSRLALGYQGGIGAYSRMCSSYGVDISPIFPEIWQGASYEEREKAQKSYLFYAKKIKEPYSPVPVEVGYTSDIIKQRFREANPRIVDFWFGVNEAAIAAVEIGKPVGVKTGPYAQIIFFTYKQFLYCRLPNGKDIIYPFPKIDVTSKGNKTLSYRYVDERNNWVRGGTYGGKLTENIVQAIQRELLVDAMLRLNAAGYDIRLHIHDELVAIVRRLETAFGLKSLDKFISIMKDSQPWANGLPVNANGWVGARYGKE